MNRITLILGCGPSLMKLRPDQYHEIQSRGATIICVHLSIDWYSTPDIWAGNVLEYFWNRPKTWSNIVACKRRVLIDDNTLTPSQRYPGFESWTPSSGVEDTGLKCISFAFQDLKAECVVLCGIDRGAENVITGEHVQHIGNPYRYKRSGKMLKIGGAYPCPEISVDALLNFKFNPRRRRVAHAPAQSSFGDTCRKDVTGSRLVEPTRRGPF